MNTKKSVKSVASSTKSIVESAKSSSNAKFFNMVRPFSGYAKTSPKTSQKTSQKAATVMKNFGLSLAEYEILVNTNPKALFEINEKMLKLKK